MNDTGVQISPYDHKQSLHLCKESILHCQRGSEHSNICFWKIQHLVFLSQMTELKSVDYLQIFLSPPKLFIFLYLLAFLSCPVTLYTSMTVHIVFFMSVLPSGPSHLLSVRHILRGKPSLKKKINVRYFRETAFTI